MATVRELVTEWGFDIDDRPLKAMDRSLAGLKSSIAGMGLALAGVGGLVGGVFIRQAGIMEQAKIAFETMLGSAAAARDLLKDITTFAAKTPFEIPDLIESSKRLLAFGFAANEIIPTMQSLGNIAAGVGREKLPQLILALGQVRAATMLRGQELRQFTEAGVPMIEEIAKMKGVAEKEVQDMVSRGEISFRDTEAALRNLTSGSGRFANLMEKQSKSLFGVLSNLKDWFTVLSIEIGEGLMPQVKELVNGIYDWLTANRELIKSKVAKFVKILMDAMKVLLGALQSAVYLLKAVANAFGGVEKAIELLIKAAVLFLALKFFTSLGGIIFNAFQIAKALTAMGNAALFAQVKLLAIPILIGLALAAIGLLIEDIVSYFQGKDSITGRLIQQLQEHFPEAINLIKAFFEFWKNLVMMVVDAFVLIWRWMMRIAEVANNAFQPMIGAMKTLVGWGMEFLKILDKIFLGLPSKIIGGIAEKTLAGVDKIKEAFSSPRKAVQGYANIYSGLAEKMHDASAAMRNAMPTEEIKNAKEAIKTKIPVEPIRAVGATVKESLPVAGIKTAGEKVQSVVPSVSSAMETLTPTTNPVANAPSVKTAQTNVQTNTVSMRPNINVNVTGGATNEQTGAAVAEHVKTAIDSMMREAGRDLSPAIER